VEIGSMHIVCPHCTTSYAIDLATLGAAGRTVRCSRCKEVWQARPQDAVEVAAPVPAMAAAAMPKRPESKPDKAIGIPMPGSPMSRSPGTSTSFGIVTCTTSVVQPTSMVSPTASGSGAEMARPPPLDQFVAGTWKATARRCSTRSVAARSMPALPAPSAET